MKKNRRPSARRLAARQSPPPSRTAALPDEPKKITKNDKKQTNTSALSGTLAPPSRGAARPASPDADGPDDISNTGST